MIYKSKVYLWTLLLLPVLLLLPLKEVCAQADKLIALKQSLDENKKRLRQYHWIETTIISLKGEEKSRIQKQCFYGPDGKVQKQQISASQPDMPGGLRGRIAKRKKEEISDYMKQAVALVHQYVPPDPLRMQKVKNAGNLSFTPSPSGPGTVRMDFRGYVKPGDLFSITVDTGSNSIQKVNVNTYLDYEKDAITVNANFTFLSNGISYPANIVLVAPEKNVQVEVQNSNYQTIGVAH